MRGTACMLATFTLASCRVLPIRVEGSSTVAVTGAGATAATDEVAHDVRQAPAPASEPAAEPAAEPDPESWRACPADETFTRNGRAYIWHTLGVDSAEGCIPQATRLLNADGDELWSFSAEADRVQDDRFIIDIDDHPWCSVPKGTLGVYDVDREELIVDEELGGPGPLGVALHTVGIEGFTHGDTPAEHLKVRVETVAPLTLLVDVRAVASTHPSPRAGDEVDVVDAEVELRCADETCTATVRSVSRSTATWTEQVCD